MIKVNHRIDEVGCLSYDTESSNKPSDYDKYRGINRLRHYISLPMWDSLEAFNNNHITEVIAWIGHFSENKVNMA
jgi:hypothetical protein